MKFLIIFLLIALILIIGIFFILFKAKAANDARFDWSLGEPKVMENPTSATSNCATRYDWSMGMPTPVYDSTASCPAAGGGGGAAPEIWWE